MSVSRVCGSACWFTPSANHCVRTYYAEPTDKSHIWAFARYSINCFYVGGTLCDHWQRKRITEAPLKVGVIGALCAGVCFCLAMAHQQVTWTIVLLAPALFFLALPVGSSYAALQLIFPNQLRVQVSALLLFTINVDGLILGPCTGRIESTTQ